MVEEIPYTPAPGYAPIGGGAIDELTSTGMTVTVTDPTGPTTNIELASPVSIADGGTDGITAAAALANLGAMPANVPITAQPGTTYTFALTDAGTIVESTSGSSTVFTIPTNATVAFPIGTQIVALQAGTGALTVTGATGVTVNGTSAGSSAGNGRYQTITLLKIATDTWLAVPSGVAGANPVIGPPMIPIAGRWTVDGLNGGTLGSNTWANGVAYAIPMIVGPGFPPIKKLGVSTNAGGTSGSVHRLGLYADNGSQYPGALIVDAGTVTTTSSYSDVSVTLGTPYQPSTWAIIWKVVVQQGAPATTANLKSVNSGQGYPILAATSQGNAGNGSTPLAYSLSGVTGALPSTFTAGATEIDSQPGGSTAVMPIVEVGY